MGSLWIYKYRGNTIVVKNERAVELLVNNQVQDRKTGIFLKADLTGKLDSGEKIKASLGGLVDVECSLFIDNVLQVPVKVE